MDLIKDVRAQLQLADQKVATFETSHKELHEHQAALTKNHIDCYKALVKEQHERLEWTRAYEHVCEAYNQLTDQLQGMHETKLSLFQKLNDANETVQGCQTRIAALEGLYWEHVNPHSQGAEQATAAVTEQLEDGVGEEAMEPKGEPLNAVDSAEEQAQNVGKVPQGAKPPEADFIPSPAVDDESHSEHWQGRNGGKASRRLRARKARLMKARGSDMRIEGD